jgi:hypothetical protein
LVRSIGPTRNEEKLHLIVLVQMDVVRITEERFDFDLRLLAAFADGGRFGGLAWFDLAARKFPEAGQGDAGGPLADEELAFVLDDGDGDGRGHPAIAAIGRRD